MKGNTVDKHKAARGCGPPMRYPGEARSPRSERMADAKPGMRKKKEVFKSPERFNWLISLLYGRQEFGECLKVVEQALEESGGLNEYPLYIKALIMRQQGKIQESLTLFQSATCLNPSNVANLKQVGHSLYLLGKHKAALGVYKQAREMSADMQRSSSDGGRADAGDGKGRFLRGHDGGVVDLGPEGDPDGPRVRRRRLGLGCSHSMRATQHCMQTLSNNLS